MNTQPYNAWKLVSLTPLPLWSVVLLSALVFLSMALAAWGVRREPLRSRKWLLSVLRLGAALCALFFLLEPGLRRLQVAVVKNRVAVVVDRSASMNFPVEPQGPTRSQAVADFLDAQGPNFDALKERFNVEFYGFDPELSAVSSETLRREPARSGKTDLLSALRTLQSSEQGSAQKKLSGVLLFSDGADNVEWSTGQVSPRAEKFLAQWGVPVSTFAVGKETLKDLAIDTIKVDDFAFVRNSLSVEVEVRARGFAGQQVAVVLEGEGKVVANKVLDFTENEETKKVEFTFTPDQTGRFVYTVSVPVFPEETVIDNNNRSFSLKVIRDRVRVLLVVGRPSWDERFLRGLLRQDPNVDLVSFYILRTTSDNVNVANPDRELSLIPFPMEEIFDTKLNTFDVVVFQNFGYIEPQLSISYYEKNLERYVYNGGAFLIIGGDNSLGEGRATLPLLMQALPVEVAGPADVRSFVPRLTEQGLRHPVTALAPGSQLTQTAWEGLPALPGANMTRAKTGAAVLLEHPSAQVDGKNAPILALWEYGRGRSMALMVDGSWYWAFLSHAQGAGGRPYEKFWGNALRWLVRDPDLTTLQVTAEPPSVEPGKPVGVLVLTRTSDYQPASSAEVTVDLFSVKTQKVVATQQGTTGQDGLVRLEFSPPAPGAYKLLAKAHKGTTSLGEGEDSVAVRSLGPELADASVHPSVLENMAKLSKGRFTSLANADVSKVPLLDPPSVEVGRSEDEPLWDKWYYLVTLLFFMGMEWLLRRRFGYV